MSDFREDDHARPAFREGTGMGEGAPRSVRKVVSREGDVVTLEDEWGRRRFRTKARLDPARREVRLEGEFGYRGVWRAVPEGEGTRLEAETRIAPPFPFSLLTPLFGGKLKREAEKDFNGHVADLAHELGEKR